MMHAALPSRPIAVAVGRTLLTSKSRWAYVTLTMVNSFIIVGGGFAMGGSLTEFLQAAAGLLVVNLHILWVWFALSLMAMNDPTAARLVPHYVSRLRTTALWIWASIVVITGLLDGANGGGVLWAAVASASTMILLITPFRWPVRWGIAILLLAQLLSRVTPFISKDFLIFLKPWAAVLGLTCLGLCAVIVLFLFDRKGGNYGRFFAGVSVGGTTRKGTSVPQPKLVVFGVWGLRGLLLGQWLLLPFAIYARRLLQRRTPGDRHFMARAELGFGATAHWVLQIEMLLGLLVGIAVLVAVQHGRMEPFALADIAPHAFGIALCLMAIAVLPSMSMPELFRKTTVEQKLLLLLPGMPRGNTLTRQLAKRQLIQGYASWSVAAAIAVGIPLEGVELLMATSGYLAILILMPLLPTTNWASLAPLSAVRALLAMTLLAAVGGGVLAAQHWGLVPVAVLFAGALSTSLALTCWRWSLVQRHPQAFPVGHLAAAAA